MKNQRSNNIEVYCKHNFKSPHFISGDLPPSYGDANYLFHRLRKLFRCSRRFDENNLNKSMQLTNCHLDLRVGSAIVIRSLCIIWTVPS